MLSNKSSEISQKLLNSVVLQSPPPHLLVYIISCSIVQAKTVREQELVAVDDTYGKFLTHVLFYQVKTAKATWSRNHPLQVMMPSKQLSLINSCLPRRQLRRQLSQRQQPLVRVNPPSHRHPPLPATVQKANRKEWQVHLRPKQLPSLSGRLQANPSGID